MFRDGIHKSVLALIPNTTEHRVAKNTKKKHQNSECEVATRNIGCTSPGYP